MKAVKWESSKSFAIKLFDVERRVVEPMAKTGVCSRNDSKSMEIDVSANDFRKSNGCGYNRKMRRNQVPHFQPAIFSPTLPNLRNEKNEC